MTTMQMAVTQMAAVQSSTTEISTTPAQRARGWFAGALVACGGAGLFAPLAAAAADTAGVPMSSGWAFTETDGESIYRAVCQACHMADGKGATGAATYPALAANPRLASGAYLAVTVLQGRRSMPAFGRALTDAQIAEVARYVRTNMCNSLTSPLTAADVKTLR